MQQDFSIDVSWGSPVNNKSPLGDSVHLRQEGHRKLLIFESLLLRHLLISFALVDLLYVQGLLLPHG